MNSLFSQPSSWLGMLSSVGMLLLGHVANKYIIPFLKIGKRKQYAQYVATIADEITDDLKNKHPQKDWLKYLDTAVDTLISICDISPQVARRAISAAMSRK